ALALARLNARWQGANVQEDILAAVGSDEAETAIGPAPDRAVLVAHFAPQCVVAPSHWRSRAARSAAFRTAAWTLHSRASLRPHSRCAARAQFPMTLTSRCSISLLL